jgi:hypothetical protein
MLLRNLAIVLGEGGWTTSLLDSGDTGSDVVLADIVLVDEAQRMSAERLDELSGRDGRAIVLAALPSFAAEFQAYPGVTVVSLAALSPDQARSFLAERLAQLELPTDYLTEAAWTRLIERGHGLPRLLIVLLRLAALVAAEDDARQVTEAHVEQAVQVRGGDAEEGEVERVLAEADPAGYVAPVSLAGAMFVGGGRERYFWHTRVVMVLAAVCLFSAAALMLTLGERRHEEQTASQPRAPAAVAGTGSSALVASATEQPALGGSASTATTTPPQAPPHTASGVVTRLAPPLSAGTGSSALVASGTERPVLDGSPTVATAPPHTTGGMLASPASPSAAGTALVASGSERLALGESTPTPPALCDVACSPAGFSAASHGARDGRRHDHVSSSRRHGHHAAGTPVRYRR